MKTSRINRYIAPALVLLATLISWIAAWSVIEVEAGTQTFTLKEMMDGDMVDMIWVWISGIGVLMVVVSAFIGDSLRQRLAQVGSVLAVILPVKVLWDGFTREATPGMTISPGWGLWVALILTVLAILAASLVNDDTETVVHPTHTSDDPNTVVGTSRT